MRKKGELTRLAGYLNTQDSAVEKAVDDTATDKMIVVKTNYKNYTFTLDEDNLYIAVVDADEGASFQDAVITDTELEDYSYSLLGSISVPVYAIVSNETLAKLSSKN